jgi:hypothetical protein
MNGARDEVLADSAFARQQDRGAGRRDAHDGGEDFLHGGAPSDDVVKGVAPPQFFTKLQVLVAQRAHFERLPDDGHQVIE